MDETQSGLPPDVEWVTVFDRLGRAFSYSLNLFSIPGKYQFPWVYSIARPTPRRIRPRLERKRPTATARSSI